MSATTTAAPATTTTWTIDPVHSNAEFRVRHLMISHVRGQFTGVTGKLTYDSTDIPKSRVEASIDVATIDTRDSQRDTHLKSPDFFDAEKFPTLTFSSSRVTRRADGHLIVAGPLSIHGVTREVEFTVEGPTPPVKDPWGNTRFGYNLRGAISRSEYGLKWNQVLETGGMLVSDNVDIEAELQVVQKG
jgi:polyisoprenoid-binding protein YceI